MNKRIKSCLQQLKKLNCDSFIASDPINIAYLTGFCNGEGYLLVAFDEKPIYFTNFLYRDKARKLKGWEIIVSSINNKYSIFDLIAKKIKMSKYRRVGFEAKSLPFLEYKTLNEHLSKERIEFTKTIDFIEKMRMIKDNDEIPLIKKSIQISSEAFEFIKEIFSEEMSEKTLSIEIEKFLRLKGDNDIAFSTIVASGKNTIFPHHIPETCRIRNKFFIIDLGAKYYGYCADLTRVFFGGKMPLLFKKMYDTVKKAQVLSIQKIKEGVRASEIDKVAREFIDKNGWGSNFGHGLGHGIGLCVHELPYLCPNNDEILKEGMVLTIEPAIYLKGEFGIRIEDMVLVKQKKAEILSGDIHK